MTQPRWMAAGLLLLGALCSPAPARAGDVAVAEAQFDRGLKEMEAGHYDVACPAFEESYKQDPRPGTLFTLAECEFKRGRFATASVRYDDYLSTFAKLTPAEQGKQKGREKVAEQQKAALAGKIPKLTVKLAADAPPGSTVTRAGATLSAASLGVALPIDPGTHVVALVTPDGKKVEKSVTLGAGESKTLELGLEGATGGGPPPPPGGETDKPSGGPSGQLVAGAVVVGVGGLGLVLGAITGGLALGDKGVVDQECQGLVCSPKGKAAADDGKVMGTVSTIGFVVGGAAAVAGIVLIATAPKGAAPKKAQVVPLFGATPGGVFGGIGGRF